MSHSKNISLKEMLYRRRIKFLFISILLMIAVVGQLILIPGLTWKLQILALATAAFVVSVLWELLRLINNLLDKYYPYERSIRWRIAYQCILGIITIISVRLIVTSLFIGRIPFHIDRGLLVASFALNILISLLVNAGYFSLHFFNEWQRTLLNTERIRKEQAQVQFDNLKNQLNPHFLFNSLTSLNSLISINQELAAQFLQHLSRVYRYVLQHKEKETVSLDTEVKFIRNYIFLLETRFDGGIKIDLDIEKDKEERGITPVTTQVLIENAVKHNSLGTDSPLHIEIFTEGEYLLVRNNLQKKSIVEHSHKMGLENLKNLYTFLTDVPVEIQQDGKHFTIKIPLL